MSKDSPDDGTARITAWSVDQAVAILAVDNVYVSASVRELLKRCVKGEITVEEARGVIRERARAYARRSQGDRGD